jgi:hypothetical protein
LSAYLLLEFGIIKLAWGSDTLEIKPKHLKSFSFFYLLENIMTNLDIDYIKNLKNTQISSNTILSFVVYSPYPQEYKSCRENAQNSPRCKRPNFFSPLDPSSGGEP